VKAKSIEIANNSFKNAPSRPDSCTAAMIVISMISPILKNITTSEGVSTLIQV
jgi:hypothetical protein